VGRGASSASPHQGERMSRRQRTVDGKSACHNHPTSIQKPGTPPAFKRPEDSVCAPKPAANLRSTPTSPLNGSTSYGAISFSSGLTLKGAAVAARTAPTEMPGATYPRICGCCTLSVTSPCGEEARHEA